MSETILKLMAELRAQLLALYGARLKGVYLYGSHARGGADNESDVDVLVVLDQIQGYGQELNRTSSSISSLSLKYRLSISRVFVSEKDWTSRQTPFLANVREEAIPA